jgi:hypothetical protein
MTAPIFTIGGSPQPDAASPTGNAALHLQQLSKLVDGQACVSNDATHSEGIDGIATGDGNDSNAVRHDDVPALADNAEAGFLQSLHGLKVGDPGQLPHS